MDVSQVLNLSVAIVLAWYAYDNVGEVFQIVSLKLRRRMLADTLAQAEATIREAHELRAGIAETRATLRDLDATRQEKIATWRAEAVSNAQRENADVFACNRELREEAARLKAKAGECRRELAERQRLFDLDMERMRATKRALLDAYEAEARERLRVERAELERQRADMEREWRSTLDDVERQRAELHRAQEEHAAQAHELTRQHMTLTDAQSQLARDQRMWDSYQLRAVEPAVVTNFYNFPQCNSFTVPPAFFFALVHGDQSAQEHGARMIEDMDRRRQ